MVTTEIRPGTSFAEVTDYWVFCGARLLNFKWERARALAKTEEHHDVLRKIEAKLRKELQVEAARNGRPLVLQVAGQGLYVGPLIRSRFQVLESMVPMGTYYVIDHKVTDLVIRISGPGSDTRRFGLVAEAEAYIKRFTSDPVYDTGSPLPNYEQETDMAKAATKIKDAPAKKGPARTVGKAPTPAVQSAPAPKAAGKGGKTAPTPPAPPVEQKRPGRGLSTDGTVSAMTRSLIMAGKLTDEKIIEQVRAAFPDKTVASNVVTHYRAVLMKNGLTPPGPK